jgi:tetratricopeptide (TPR) repeat protein
MKSGLWILVVVLVAAVIVGVLLRPRLRRLVEDQVPPDQTKVGAIEKIEDPAARLERLRAFMSENPESEAMPRAYRILAETMLEGLKDTTGYVTEARRILGEEKNPDNRTEVYFWLFSAQAASDSAGALETAHRLLGESIETSWIYNYVGYDLAERGFGLGTALGLCDRALQFAESATDSAGIMDSRGWANYKMGRYGRAVADLEAAAGLEHPPQEEILRHLATAAESAGQGDLAFETLRTVLVMGEYGYARAGVDSMMDARGYSDDRKAAFDESLWEERMSRAEPGAPFALPTLGGGTYRFEPGTGRVAVLNFMSPT